MGIKTSKQWWEEVKSNPKKFNKWLEKQYVGEFNASRRISRFADMYATDDKTKFTLNLIASQESIHARWVLDLLKARGIEPKFSPGEDRYWRETLPEIKDFQTGAAVGAHAEAMRLERIRVISEDPEAPEDVRDVFKRILKDEVFHERAFRKMAGEEAMAQTKPSHAEGRKVLGLEP